jgi:hypothetical protein
MGFGYFVDRDSINGREWDSRLNDLFSSSKEEEGNGFENFLTVIQTIQAQSAPSSRIGSPGHLLLPPHVAWGDQVEWEGELIKSIKDGYMLDLGYDPLREI